MAWPPHVAEALLLPHGARFYKCALQVNPYEYLRRHGRPSSFADEAAYNEALVQACREQGIEVIAVTDHYRVSASKGLIQAAKDAGLLAFPAFEAVTKEGVHLLCIFDLATPLETLERFIGACGIPNDDHESPTGKFDAEELLDESTAWGFICIAAHVTQNGGLLYGLKGQSRMGAWKHKLLLAAAIPGSLDAAPENLKNILRNEEPQYRRPRSVALLNASDVDGPQDIVTPGASSWIKMSDVSVEGLRQAFLDPSSRIRLASDPPPDVHSELAAIGWQGGFLDGCAVHFNENLNVLIGGRGTGKSTVIESLRYVLGLEPLGDDARKAHDGNVKSVLRSGTKISVLVRSHRPAPREYLIERTVPNPPVVRDENGGVLDLLPRDIIPRAEVYGQHEIGELAKSKEKLTRVLERFVERDPSLGQRKAEASQRLERLRARIVEVQDEQRRTTERLATLPALEETLKRFQEAGLEERLKEQSFLVREESVLDTMDERVTPINEAVELVQRTLPVDRAFLSERSLVNLPARDTLLQGSVVLEALEGRLEAGVAELRAAIDEAKEGISTIRGAWSLRQQEVQAAYEKILRELQKTRVDGEEFIRLRRQIENLRPLAERLRTLNTEMQQLRDARRSLLAEWEDIKTAEYRRLDQAAKEVTRRLARQVRVQVNYGGDREPLWQLLREQVGGRLNEAIISLKQVEQLSLRELAEACRGGKEALAQRYAIPPSQADRLAQASEQTWMTIEELELPSTTEIELNVAGEGKPSVWRRLEDLSTGQKATAVLLLLLLESDAPLIVDQPEDDLDNRFISEGVVPRMKDEKRRRQFIFATHNANIPVLADAELIVGLEAKGEADGGATIDQNHMGSIDQRPVKELVEELLEGGQEAFEVRRLKYGF